MRRGRLLVAGPAAASAGASMVRFAAQRGVVGKPGMPGRPLPGGIPAGRPGEGGRQWFEGARSSSEVRDSESRLGAYE